MNPLLIKELKKFDKEFNITNNTTETYLSHLLEQAERKNFTDEELCNGIDINSDPEGWEELDKLGTRTSLRAFQGAQKICRKMGIPKKK